MVPTHFSNLDSVLLGWALFEMGLPPFCFGAGLNLFSNPLLGYFMNHLGAYKIDRRKKHSLYRWTLMNYSSVALENDCHSLFFPGGGRSRSGAPEFVEGNLKPGLLSTVLRAYIRNIQKKKTNPNLYIVPCVISYHVVLEATSLIEEHLKRTGANRFMIDNDESFAPKTIAKFIYNFMRGSSSVNLHFCRPLDPFGNLVSEDGLSRNQAGRILNLPDYITTDGEIGSKPQRDREYGLNLNQKILDRYKQENVVLSSHFIAYVFFEYLLQRFGEGDPLRLFKHQTEQCKLTTDELRTYAVPILKKLQILHEGGGVLLEPVLRSNDFDQVLESAGRNLAVFHTARPILVEGQNVGTEDLRLLYYYHNRLEGYG
ncbi:MAG TPA: 1-acyl-sn-glycerol-3-phosphate acyltransferase, partial [Oligoflexia bacterium]|nr:1-acyl-sn-glycerol-3-phosphate acyltransferase [Oligoflexia bacterium]